MRVALQVFSLLAVSLFFISFTERVTLESEAHTAGLRIALYALLAVSLGSLALYKISPALAYDQTVERLTWDNAHRFKGLFGKPSGVAAAAGILFGLCLFTRGHWIVRGVGAGAALLCLYLTLSRSFWIGATLASLVTAAFYVKQKRLILAAGAIGLVLVIAAATVVPLKMPALGESKMLRSESLENLSGRTAVWSMALDRFWDRPVLGYGYTVGHHAFFVSRNGRAGEFGSEQVDLLQKETFSLHNGYVQALLDSGAVGALFYVLIMAVTLWRIVRYDVDRRHPVVLYGIVFLGIANIGETVVYTPATFHAAFYWYAAAVALSLTGVRPSPAPEPVREPSAPSPIESFRYPLVSRPAPRGG